MLAPQISFDKDAGKKQQRRTKQQSQRLLHVLSHYQLTFENIEYFQEFLCMTPYKYMYNLFFTSIHAPPMSAYFFRTSTQYMVHKCSICMCTCTKYNHIHVYYMHTCMYYMYMYVCIYMHVVYVCVRMYLHACSRCTCTGSRYNHYTCTMCIYVPPAPIEACLFLHEPTDAPRGATSSFA